MKMLWIAPIFNGYRFHLLKNYVTSSPIQLSILSGYSEINKEDELGKFDFFKQLKLSKIFFGFSIKVLYNFIRVVSKYRFNIVMMPIEKKFLFLIVFIYILKFFYGYKLISYNHPLRSKNLINKFITKLIFSMYDKIVFYTEKSMVYSRNQHLIDIHKSSFANNTLFFQSPNYKSIIKDLKTVPFTLIYIGRLRENKKIDKLFDLYTAFKQRDYNVRLKIIGDGKMSKYIEQKQKIFSGIFWYGRITDESQIKKHMEESHLSVNLGLTGLSIVHSFYYGLPYVTLAHSGHGPEIDYLIDSYNGIIGKDILDAFSRIKNLMSNQDKYEEMSLNAIKTMEQISHLNWYQQMDNSISSI